MTTRNLGSGYRATVTTIGTSIATPAGRHVFIPDGEALALLAFLQAEYGHAKRQPSGHDPDSIERDEGRVDWHAAAAEDID